MHNRNALVVDQGVGGDDHAGACGISALWLGEGTDWGQPGTRLVAPDVDGVDAEDNGEDAGDAEWRNAFAKDADSENQDQGGAEAAGDGVGDREVGAAVGGGEGAEVEGVEETGQGDPDPAVGRDGVLGEQDEETAPGR